MFPELRALGGVSSRSQEPDTGTSAGKQMGPLLAVNRDFYKCLLPKCLGPGELVFSGCERTCVWYWGQKGD